MSPETEEEAVRSAVTIAAEQVFGKRAHRQAALEWTSDPGIRREFGKDAWALAYFGNEIAVNGELLFHMPDPPRTHELAFRIEVDPHDQLVDTEAAIPEIVMHARKKFTGELPYEEVERVVREEFPSLYKRLAFGRFEVWERRPTAKDWRPKRRRRR